VSFQHKSTNGCKTGSGRAGRAFGLDRGYIGRIPEGVLNANDKLFAKPCAWSRTVHSSSVVCETGQGPLKRSYLRRISIQKWLYGRFGLSPAKALPDTDCWLEEKSGAGKQAHPIINRANIVQIMWPHLRSHDKGVEKAINGTCSPPIARNVIWSAFRLQWVQTSSRRSCWISDAARRRKGVFVVAIPAN